MERLKERIRNKETTEDIFSSVIKISSEISVTDLIDQFVSSKKEEADYLMEDQDHNFFLLHMDHAIAGLLSALLSSYHREQSCAKKIHLKDDFLNIVCHDLRNPLGVIGTCCNFILDGYKKNHVNIRMQIDFLNRIKNSVNKASEMVSNLLDINRIQHNSSIVTFQQVRLGEYLRDLKNHLNILAQPKSIQLVIEPYEQEILVSIDPARFAQIIENLVINAIKFSPGNTKITIRFKISTETDQDQLPDCIIDIIDQGYGIPDDKIKTLFDIFEQGSHSENFDASGFGIGLFIVKQFTQLHHGKIVVKNNHDRGATFSLILPRATTEDCRQSTKNFRAKILLVEDDQDVAEFLRLTLVDMNLDVLTANDGEEGSAIFLHEEPDIVLSDLKLPKKDGFELLQEIKSIRPKIPYILMTGYYDSIYNEHALKIFMADKILHKPFGREELELCINKILPQEKKSE